MILRGGVEERSPAMVGVERGWNRQQAAVWGELLEGLARRRRPRISKNRLGIVMIRRTFWKVGHPILLQRRSRKAIRSREP